MTDLRKAAQQALEKIALAHAKIDALCLGNERWTMSVPARPDHDHDLVISGALYAAAEVISAALAQPDVPEGYVLVPVEPTPEMLKAAVVYANGNAVYKNVAAEALRIEESIYGEVYAAMLAAAQKGGA